MLLKMRISKNIMKKEKVTEILDSGLVYEGEAKSGKWHGKGILSSPDGFRYEGHFKNGLPNGLGFVKFPDEGSYEGRFKDGLKHGNGTLISPEGDRYEGQFKNDTQNGIGIYEWSDGRIYEGQFKDGLQHGNGKHTMPDGRYFEGEFKKGKKTEKGEFYCKDGTEYKENKKGFTITKELLGEIIEDEEIVEFSDKEKELFLRDITSISNDDGEPWTCAYCEMEKESNEKQHLFQNGLVCPDCFDSAMGFDYE